MPLPTPPSSVEDAPAVAIGSTETKLALTFEAGRLDAEFAVSPLVDRPRVSGD